MATNKANNHADIKSDHWLIKYAPKPIRPYLLLARIDRPIGIWLLLMPSLWSIVLASGGIAEINISDLKIIALFCFGAILMRSAGCIINDLWDKDLDKKVSRTAARPLAAGILTTKQALSFLALLLGLSLLILLQLNLITILLGILTIPLIITYPLMKRWTWWPQAFLGLVFNFGALMGWSAITGIIEYPALLIYISGIFWTLGYDTIYAHQDKDDDAMIGIKSTALKFGDHSKKWVKGFYLLSCLTLIAALSLSYEGIITALYLIPAFLYLIWILRNWDETRPESALKTFINNQTYGALILIGLLLS